ncbi:aldehyde dehydrogenase family protein [Fibrobacter sp.]|uniref:aldehyde dehydrogenase family protein n=1 Tax=Fibrobacter sp. TaxID=35828 RepID=UPI00388EF806
MGTPSVQEIFEAQGRRRWAIAQTGAKDRIAKLKRLREALVARQREFYDAVWQDFHKSEFEAWECEIFPAIEEIDCAIKNLKKWMKDKPAKRELVLPTTKSVSHFEPKGRVLIFAPWNYPLLLLVSPIVSAIAAGNVIMAKPSHKTPRVGAFLKSLFESIFESDEIAIVEGAGAEIGDILLSLPFDHVFFTGSPRVGAHVEECAAKVHAGVTLELGGKSPTILLPDLAQGLRASGIANECAANNTRLSDKCAVGTSRTDAAQTHHACVKEIRTSSTLKTSRDAECGFRTSRDAECGFRTSRALKTAAKRIAWGKMLNAGQTCIAPDYVLCPRELVNDFAEACAVEIKRMYGETESARQECADLVHIIDERAIMRHTALIADAIAKGATAVIGGRICDDRTELELGETANRSNTTSTNCAGSNENQAKSNEIRAKSSENRNESNGNRAEPVLNRAEAPTILANVTSDMEIMQSEIFGPILPIVAYDSLDEAISFVQNRPKPLALYIFGKARRDIKRVLTQTTSGSTCVNNTIIQIENLSVPFGGVGNSGTGNYHGFYGFKAFSHERNVMKQGFFDAVSLFHAPYNKKRLTQFMQKALKFIKRF